MGGLFPLGGGGGATPATPLLSYQYNSASSLAGGELTRQSSTVTSLGLDSATPAAMTFRGQNSRGGTDSDVAGGNLVVSSGAGTGAAAATSIAFQTPTVGATGSVQQTLTTRFTVATAVVTVAAGIPLQLGTWTTAGRPSSPAAGMIGWNTTIGSIDYYDGSNWQQSATTWTISGNNFVPTVTNTGDIGTSLLKVKDIYLAGLVKLDSASTVSWNADTFIVRDAANTIGIRNGASAQNLNIYNGYTDGSNYGRVNIGYTAAVDFQIKAENAGTGSGANILIAASAGGILSLTGNTGTWKINPQFVAESDNTYDIGTSADFRPRSIYFATSIQGHGRTLTASAPLLDLSQTWNSSGVTFNAIKLNVTNTASASASTLLDLQKGSASMFSVDRSGQLLINGGSATAGNYIQLLFKEEQISVANGVSTQDGTSNWIPASAFILAITFKVDVQPGNTSTMTAGSTTSTAAYLGNSMATTAGTTATGGPNGSAANTFGEIYRGNARTVRLTFDAATNDAAGRVTVKIWYILPTVA